MVSGGGPYADEWHDFPTTSARLAEIISTSGYSVGISFDVESALSRPGDCRLLAGNIGRPLQPPPAEATAAVRSGLQNHLAAGRSLLAMHSSIMSLTTMPEWREILRGTWIDGRSMHPPRGKTTILRSAVDHPITAGLTDFQIVDERYSYLETDSGITVLYEHEHDGVQHPLVWARPSDQYRVVYDGLGHDSASYDSAGHRTLLSRSVNWLLGGG